MPAVDMAPELQAVVAHADDNLVLAQRLGEWISTAPELEEDIALGNIALDHLGVARALYTHAGELEGKGRSEDDFAMRRTEREFLNVLLVEQPNGDFAQTVVRQFFFDVYQRLLWDDLAASFGRSVSDLASLRMRGSDDGAGAFAVVALAQRIGAQLRVLLGELVEREHTGGIGRSQPERVVFPGRGNRIAHRRHAHGPDHGRRRQPAPRDGTVGRRDAHRD